MSNSIVAVTVEGRHLHAVSPRTVIAEAVFPQVVVAVAAAIDVFDLVPMGE